MAKTAKDIRKSRRERERLKTKWGGQIPDTVWDVNYSLHGGIYRLGKTQQKVATKKQHERILSEEVDQNIMYKCCNMWGRSVRGKGGGLSVFPYDVLRRSILFYTEEGDTVLDPCAGHNSRMQGVWQLGRSYIGYDVCHEFMEFNRKIAKKIQKRRTEREFFKRGTGTITLIEESSECMEEVEDESVDFILTSPPYWDLEYYDEHPDQLGFGHTYEEFLDGLERVVKECYRTLKPGKFCIFNVNDFIKDGTFYTYHSDLKDRFLKTDFVLWDTIIIRWPGAFKSMFASQLGKTKRLGKAHEYLMVFKKPE